MKEYKDDAVFTVSLDGVKLSSEQKQRLDHKIKDAVMTELANIDHKGDLVINKKLMLNPKFNDLVWSGRTMGIWIEDIDRFRGRLQGF